MEEMLYFWLLVFLDLIIYTAAILYPKTPLFTQKTQTIEPNLICTKNIDKLGFNNIERANN